MFYFRSGQAAKFSGASMDVSIEGVCDFITPLLEIASCCHSCLPIVITADMIHRAGPRLDRPAGPALGNSAGSFTKLKYV
jgi:hypothetical protein